MVKNCPSLDRLLGQDHVLGAVVYDRDLDRENPAEKAARDDIRRHPDRDLIRDHGQGLTEGRGRDQTLAATVEAIAARVDPILVVDRALPTTGAKIQAHAVYLECSASILRPRNAILKESLKNMDAWIKSNLSPIPGQVDQEVLPLSTSTVLKMRKRLKKKSMVRT